jgi:orotate phosphoribosyltransferase
MTSPDREALRHDVIAASYLRGSFVLASLGTTSVYFDKYRFITQPSILRRVAVALVPLIDEGVDRLACVELGAVPLTAALSLEIGLPFTILRRQPRGSDDVEGELAQGDRVALVEDVVATGEHALSAVHRLRSLGADVRQAIAVVDRSEGAASRLEAADVRLTSLFVVQEPAS